MKTNLDENQSRAVTEIPPQVTHPEQEIIPPGEKSTAEKERFNSAQGFEPFAQFAAAVQDEHARLDLLEHLLDSAFTLPGTKIRFGLDPVLGFVPVIGDTIGAVISLYLLNEARRAELPWWKRGIMVKNIFVDWLFGLIPFVGDILDIGVRSNTKNVRIIKEHLNRKKREK
jgi:Domain of unknown function (DUF4112)